jgi:hypothetical protein
MNSAQENSELSILLCGTGGFASRIAYDIIAAARQPLTLHIAGRNEARLHWLQLAGNGRASVLGTPAQVVTHTVDLTDRDGAASLLSQTRCDVVVQTASAQPVSVLRSGGDAWADLIKHGGYGASLVFQAIISVRVAQAMQAAGSTAHLINCCFPDAANSLLSAMDLPITSGIGNIAILSNILSGTLPYTERGSLRMLAHYRNLHDWRCEPASRGPHPARVWLNEVEVPDVYNRFPVRLSAEPVPDVSGASAALPVIALASGADWTGHLPGPKGLPGGYPVRISSRQMTLDLPNGLSETDAVSFNSQFEQADGAFVTSDKRVAYSGKLHKALSQHSPALAAGFNVRDFDEVFGEMKVFRDRLINAQPPRA